MLQRRHDYQVALGVSQTLQIVVPVVSARAASLVEHLVVSLSGLPFAADLLAGAWSAEPSLPHAGIVSGVSMVVVKPLVSFSPGCCPLLVALLLGVANQDLPEVVSSLIEAKFHVSLGLAG